MILKWGTGLFQEKEAYQKKKESSGWKSKGKGNNN